jgi:(p)ppGpp synthase/HD superfamily hydrolase
MEDSLERILACPSEVGMVKLADRITNLQPPPQHWSKGKIEEYFNEATTISDQLGFLNAALSERMKEQMNVYRSFF